MTLAPAHDIHREIRRTVREFVEREIVPIASELDNAEQEIPMPVIRKIADLGYFGLIFPEEHGGMGLDTLSMAIVAEELSRGWLSVGSVMTRMIITGSLVLGRLPNSSSVAVESRPEPSDEVANTPVTYDGATPGFFDLMGIELVAGRAFGPEHVNEAPEVAVVNEAFVRRFLGGLDPIGQRFTFGSVGPDAQWTTIVGVMGDARRSGLDQDVRPGVFSALLLAHANPGIAQVEIGNQLGIDKTSVVTLIDRMEDAGWVVRKRSSDDRRRQGIFLTPAGAKTCRALRREMIDHERKFVSRYTDQELRTLIALLRRLHDPD